jgi:hypothetical protein
MNPSKKAKQIVEKIGQIEGMERGKICRMTGRTHCNHQTWASGKNVVKYVREEELDELQKAITGYAEFKKLSEDYASEMIRLSRIERKKNAKRRSKR